MTDQYPAWSVGRSNLQALTGKTCGLADDVMVEQDPNAGMLTPVTAPGRPTPWARDLSEGFTPNGIPADVSRRPGDGTARRPQLRRRRRADHRQRGRHRRRHHAAPGINGSRAQLPYNLDPARTPVLGSWRVRHPGAGQAAVGWYRLPARDKARPAAGGVRGRPLRPPRGPACSGPPTTRRPADTPAVASFADVGAAPAWRNLRLPLSAIPRRRHPGPAGRRRRGPGAAALDRADPAADPAAAHAAGRGRVRRTRCCWTGWSGWRSRASDRSATRTASIETPKWRILPDRFGAEANSPVMDNIGGGPLGVTELLVRATTVATYLKDDWFRDWGALAAVDAVLPRRPAGAARSGGTAAAVARQLGLWSPAPLRPLGGTDICLARPPQAHRGPASSTHSAASLTIDPRAPRRHERSQRIPRSVAVIAGIVGLLLCAGPAAAGEADHGHHAVAAGPAPTARHPDHRAAGVRGAARARHLHPVPGDRHPARRAAAWCSPPCPPAAWTPARTGCSCAPTPTWSSSRSATRWPRWRRARPSPPAPAACCTSGPTPAGSAPTSSAYPAPPGTLPAEKKPQVGGIFTDLKVPAQPGLSARIDIDTRFITSPTALKKVVMVVGALAVAGVDRRAGGRWTGAVAAARSGWRSRPPGCALPPGRRPARRARDLARRRRR